MHEGKCRDAHPLVVDLQHDTAPELHVFEQYKYPAESFRKEAIGNPKTSKKSRGYRRYCNSAVGRAGSGVSINDTIAHGPKMSTPQKTYRL